MSASFSYTTLSHTWKNRAYFLELAHPPTCYLVSADLKLGNAQEYRTHGTTLHAHLKAEDVSSANSSTQEVTLCLAQIEMNVWAELFFDNKHPALAWRFNQTGSDLPPLRRL